MSECNVIRDVEVRHRIQGRYDLRVAGILVGDYIGGSDELWRDPQRWARRQVPKRLAVAERNIARLEAELHHWRDERAALRGAFYDDETTP